METRAVFDLVPDSDVRHDRRAHHVHHVHHVRHVHEHDQSFLYRGKPRNTCGKNKMLSQTHQLCCKLRETCTCQMGSLNRFNNAVFGIETREKRCSNQCKGTDQRGDPCDWHVFTQPPHVSNILIVVHTNNHRTCS